MAQTVAEVKEAKLDTATGGGTLAPEPTAKTVTELIAKFDGFVDTYKQFYKEFHGHAPSGGEGWAHEALAIVGDKTVYHVHRVNEKTKEADPTGQNPYVTDVVLIGKQDNKEQGISVELMRNPDFGGPAMRLYVWSPNGNQPIEGEQLIGRIDKMLGDLEKQMLESLDERAQSRRDSQRWREEEQAKGIKAIDDLGF